MKQEELHIVVGLCERNGRLLLIQRQDTNLQWDGFWEFPGGKIDEGESASEAIQREVKEETGLSVLNQSFFHLHHHDWRLDDKILRVHLHCFYCVVGEGDVILEQGKAYQYAWTSLGEAMRYDCLEANLDILLTFSTCTDIEHGLR
jgi:8-oxo-dGTP diphosphatase